MATPLRILLVEDHAALRIAARLMIQGEPTFELVGETDTGEQAVELAAALTPDMVLMDVQLPGEIDGVEATRRILAAVPPGSPPPLVVAFSGANDQVDSMHAAGAVGFLQKNVVANLVGTLKVFAKGRKPRDE